MEGPEAGADPSWNGMALSPPRSSQVDRDQGAGIGAWAAMSGELHFGPHVTLL